MQHIDQAVWIYHPRLITLLLGHCDRQLDKVDVVVFPSGVFRTETPPSVFSRLRIIRRPLTVLIDVDRLQPRRTDVTRRKHHTLSEMRREMRKGCLSSCGLKEDGTSLSRSLGFVLGII